MEATRQPLRRARVLDALRSRDFRLLFTAQSISLVGDSAFLVAIGWRTYTLSGAGALGLVLTLQAVGMLATLLLGGLLADRYPRRRMMIISDLARFATVGALAGVDAGGMLTLPLLAGFALATGLGAGFFQPAFGGIVPLVVEGAQLASANALLGIARQASLIVGPGIAAGLYGVTGSATVFALDALSFVVSAALLLRTRPRVVEAQPSEGAVREFAAGFRYVAAVPWLWVTIVLFSVFLMLVLAPIQVLTPKLVTEHFGLGIGAYGGFQILQGAGMIAGTVLFAQLNPRRRRGVVSYALWTLNCAAIVLFALAPWYALAGAMAVFRGAFVGFGIAVWDTMLMQRVPNHLLSRVISLDYFGSLGLMPVGLIFAGAVSDLADPGHLMAAGAALSGLMFAAFLPARWLRAVD